MPRPPERLQLRGLERGRDACLRSRRAEPADLAGRHLQRHRAGGQRVDDDLRRLLERRALEPQASVPTCTITNTKQQATPPPPKDTSPPTAPPGLTVAEARAKSVSLAWSPSTDDVGVVEYGVYRDNERIASQTELTATVSNLRCGTSYSIAVDATDAAGNRSEKARTAVSTSTCAATPSDKPGGPDKPEKPEKPEAESGQSGPPATSRKLGE